MGTYRALLVGLMLAAVATAQQSSDAAFKVQGIVVNSLTGEPLSGASVTIGERSVLTGADGGFLFTDVPSGFIWIKPQKLGYSLPLSAKSMFDIGPDTPRIVFKLDPKAVIFGQVTGQDGQPMQGATVHALAWYRLSNGRPLVNTLGQALTDKNGKYRLPLSPGRYRLAVTAGRIAGGRLSATQKMSYPFFTYYPATSDPAAAATFDLRPGQEVEAQFPISSVPLYKFAGKIVSPSGDLQRILAPQIHDPQEKVLISPVSFDPRSGAFEFGLLPAGTYTLEISGTGQQNQPVFSARKVVLSSDLTDVELALHPGISIAVTVRKESKSPLGRCWWDPLAEKLGSSDCSGDRAARLELVPMDSMRMPYGSGAGSVPDPTNFTVDGIEPGRYVVRVELPSYPSNYVQSIRSGNVDLLHHPLNVPEYGSVLPIEIVLRDDFALVQVHTKAGAEQPLVVVLPEGVLLPATQMPRFNLDNSAFSLAPGSYSIFAFDSLGGLEYLDPEFLAKYAARAVRVTVSANETKSVTLDVIHSEE